MWKIACRLLPPVSARLQSAVSASARQNLGNGASPFRLSKADAAASRRTIYSSRHPRGMVAMAGSDPVDRRLGRLSDRTVPRRAKSAGNGRDVQSGRKVHGNHGSSNHHSSNKSDNNRPTPEASFTTIQDAQTSMDDLLRRLDGLPISPSTVASLAARPTLISSAASRNDDGVIDDETSSRVQDLLRDTRSFVDQLKRSVDSGTLNPSRKHGKELSKLAECVLYSYSQIASSSSLSSLSLSRDCQDLLRVLEREWNLDVQNAHYHYAIVVANHDQDWALAGRLFDRQIDPGAGSTPVHIAIDDPQGLYAVARRSMMSEGGGNVTPGAQGTAVDPNELPAIVEHVMDAVQRLIMVSPQDQNAYVLAAGNALGYAGLWEPTVEYLYSSYMAKQFGTTLVAAVMQACLLCGQRQEAWRIFESHILGGAVPSSKAGPNAMPGSGGEWQWGGERDRLDPLCRDLALRAMPVLLAQPEDYDGQQQQRHSGSPRLASTLALNFFEQTREEGVTISKEALLGVVLACEQDGDWQSAMAVLKMTLDEDKNTSMSPWIIPGSQLVIEERVNLSSQERTTSNDLPELGGFLASVMRCCNASSNFGVSLFCLRLFQLELHSDNAKLETMNMDTDPDPFVLGPIQSLLSCIKGSEDILIASMVSLCGLRCYQSAINLYNAMKMEGMIEGGGPGETVYNYALSNQWRHGTLVVGNPWTSAQRHIHKLTAACNMIQKRRRKRNLARQERALLLEGLARAMTCCTNAHQPDLSLVLLKWMDETVFRTTAKSHQPFGVGIFNDSLTSETILARRWAHDATGAIEMFESTMESCSDDHLEKWRKTIASGLSVLIANGRGNDASRLFETLGEEVRTTEGYTAIGRFFSKENDWKELMTLYRQAVAQGYSSEEISFMAMNAVVSTKVDNRLRILRAIVEECAGNVGLDSETWVASRYWQIKKELGFYYARLLSWWNDPDRAPLDELNLAIKEFHDEKSNGLRPKSAVVRTIVAGAGLLDSMGLENVDGYNVVPRTVEGWKIILAEVLERTRESPIRYDPNFVDNVVQAYKSLGCNRECEAFIADVMRVDGTRIRKSTLSEALKAAKVENSMEFGDDIQMMLSSRITSK